MCHCAQINDEYSSLIVAQLLYLQSEDPKMPVHLYINSPGNIADHVTLLNISIVMQSINWASLVPRPFLLCVHFRYVGDKKHFSSPHVTETAWERGYIG